jgi:hypothetical protein
MKLKQLNRESEGCSTGQEISNTLPNTNVHCHVHKRQPLYPISNQMKPVHFLTPYARPLLISLSLPNPELPSGLVPSGLRAKNFVWNSVLSHACYVTRTSHPPWYDHVITFGDDHKLLSFSLCSFVHRLSFFSLLSKYATCFVYIIAVYP